VRLIASRIADAAIEGRMLQQTYGAALEEADEADVAAIASGTYSASPDDPSPPAAVAEPEPPAES